MGLRGNLWQLLDPTPVASSMGTSDYFPLCNNMAVVYAINKRSAWDQALAELIHLLLLLITIYDVTLVAHHLPGIHNTAADALSKNNLQLFRSSLPQVSPVPTIIPSSLQELLFSTWISSHSLSWMQWLSKTLQEGSCSPLAHCIHQPSGGTSTSASSSNQSTHSLSLKPGSAAL